MTSLALLTTTAKDGPPPTSHSMVSAASGYKFLQFNQSELHRKGVVELITQQGARHGDYNFAESFGREIASYTLIEAIMEGKISTLLCTNSEDGSVAGLLTYMNDICPGGEAYHIEDIVVAENLRGLGIGKLLYGAFLAQASHDKKRGVKWYTLSDNIPAQATFGCFSRRRPFGTISPMLFSLEDSPVGSLIGLQQGHGEDGAEYLARVAKGVSKVGTRALAGSDFTDFYELLITQYPDFTDVGVLREVVNPPGSQDNGGGQLKSRHMCLISTQRDTIHAGLLASENFSTFKCKKGVTVGAVVFRDAVRIKSILPRLIEGVKLERALRNGTGSVIVDTTNNDDRVRGRIQESLVSMGAKPLTYKVGTKTVCMISGSLYGGEFSNAVRSACDFLGLQAPNPRAPKLNGRTYHPKRHDLSGGSVGRGP